MKALECCVRGGLTASGELSHVQQHFPFIPVLWHISQAQGAGCGVVVVLAASKGMLLGLLGNKFPAASPHSTTSWLWCRVWGCLLCTAPWLLPATSWWNKGGNQNFCLKLLPISAPLGTLGKEQRWNTDRRTLDSSNHPLPERLVHAAWFCYLTGVLAFPWGDNFASQQPPWLRTFHQSILFFFFIPLPPAEDFLESLWSVCLLPCR